MRETYQKVRAIGSGSIATVYEGWDRHLNRTVAIKELSHRFADDREFVEKFLEGARKMAEVSHAHVLAIHHVDQSSETPWLIMELADGGTLKELAAAGPIQAEQAIGILRHALLGLCEVHRHGIVHRHIQPDNIFRCKRSYKIGDFGLPRAAQDPSLPTLSFTVPKYISPEELGQAKVTPASDLYSLGLVIYELLVGEARLHQEAERVVRSDGGASPGQGDERLWLAFHLHRAELPPASTVAPHVPEALSAILQKMMHKDPGARYTNGHEVLADLERAFGRGDTGSAALAEQRPTEPVKRLAGPSRGRRALKWAAVALGLLVLAAGIFILLPARALKVAITSQPPGAEVWFRQERVGTTPMPPTRVRLGTELTFRREGYEEARVTFSARDQKVLHAELKPVPPPDEGRAEELVEPRPAGLTFPDTASLAAALRRLASPGGGGLEIALAGGQGAHADGVPLDTPFAFRLLSDRPAYGALFVLSPDGTIYCLYPSPSRPAPLEIAARVPLTLPGDEERAAGFHLAASEPAGRHVAYLLAADEPPPPMPPGEQPNRWMTLHSFRPGPQSPAADFVRWVDSLRQGRPGATRLSVLEFDVVPAGGGGLP